MCQTPCPPWYSYHFPDSRRGSGSAAIPNERPTPRSGMGRNSQAALAARPLPKQMGTGALRSCRLKTANKPPPHGLKKSDLELLPILRRRFQITRPRRAPCRMGLNNTVPIGAAMGSLGAVDPFWIPPVFALTSRTCDTVRPGRGLFDRRCRPAPVRRRAGALWGDAACGHPGAPAGRLSCYARGGPVPKNPLTGLRGSFAEQNFKAVKRQGRPARMPVKIGPWFLRGKNVKP
jgi:hypothetical protein